MLLLKLSFILLGLLVVGFLAAWGLADLMTNGLSGYRRIRNPKNTNKQNKETKHG